MSSTAPLPIRAPDPHPEQQYLDLIRDVWSRGSERRDRTGVGTRALFGATMRFDLSDGTVPLLTTKRVFWKSAVKELLWFLSGDTNIRPLVAQGVHIWTDWPLDRFARERITTGQQPLEAADEDELAERVRSQLFGLAELERLGLVRRTHGGAVLPALSGHEDSFATRLEADVAAKERLAEASGELLPAGASVYVDSSTTSYIAVRRLLRGKLRCTLLTNSLPVMDLVCRSDAPEVELVGVGGALRTLTRSFVGPQSVHCVRAHFADYALFSVRGVTDGGYLTDPDPLEAELKRVMIGRARHPVLLLDASKRGRAALSVVAELSDVRTIIGTGFDDGALARLAGPRVDVRVA
ncbi:MAG: thymidylate synthase [Actinobacteria bacterium]|nr:thymidylate synthase [Actinomycetota bacterium]